MENDRESSSPQPDPASPERELVDSVLREGEPTDPNPPGTPVDPTRLQKPGPEAVPGADPKLRFRQVGPYHLIRLIARHGMGEIYLARKPGMEKDFALKVMLERYDAQPELRERFKREAETLQRIDHPNICTIVDAGEFQGLLYYVMPYLRGRDLREVLQTQRISYARAADIARQVADGLDKAHSRSIIHRDLKPENIVLTRSNRAALDQKAFASSSLLHGLRTRVARWLRKGEPAVADPPAPPSPPEVAETERARDAAPTLARPSIEGAGRDSPRVVDAEHEDAPSPEYRDLARVIDFGLAADLEDRNQLTNTSLVMGTPPYMAPEQFRAQRDQIGPWTDLWALGVTLYEMTTMQKPFQKENVVDLAEEVNYQDPRPPRRARAGFPRDLQSVILKSLEKNPRRRYQTGAELREELDRFLGGEPVLASSPGIASRLCRKAMRHRRAVGAAAAFFLLFVGSVFYFLWLEPYLTHRREVQDTYRAILEVYEVYNERMKEIEKECQDLYREALRRVDQPDLALALCQKIRDEYEKHVGRAPGLPEGLSHLEEVYRDHEYLRQVEQPYDLPLAQTALLAARIREGQGDADAARSEYAAAYRYAVASRGSDHPNLPEILLALGEAFLEAEQHRLARVNLERLVSGWPEANEAASGAFALARQGFEFLDGGIWACGIQGEALTRATCLLPIEAGEVQMTAIEAARTTENRNPLCAAVGSLVVGKRTETQLFLSNTCQEREQRWHRIRLGAGGKVLCRAEDVDHEEGDELLVAMLAEERTNLWIYGGSKEVVGASPPRSTGPTALTKAELPDNPSDLLLSVARDLADMELFDDALQSVRRVEDSPEATDSQRERARFLRADLLIRRGETPSQRQDEREAYRSAVEVLRELDGPGVVMPKEALDPGDGLELMSDALERLRQWPELHSVLQRLLADYPLTFTEKQKTEERLAWVEDRLFAVPVFKLSEARRFESGDENETRASFYCENPLACRWDRDRGALLCAVNPLVFPRWGIPFVYPGGSLRIELEIELQRPMVYATGFQLSWLQEDVRFAPRPGGSFEAKSYLNAVWWASGAIDSPELRLGVVWNIPDVHKAGRRQVLDGLFARPGRPYRFCIEYIPQAGIAAADLHQGEHSEPQSAALHGLVGRLPRGRYLLGPGAFGWKGSESDDYQCVFAISDLVVEASNAAVQSIEVEPQDAWERFLLAGGELAFGRAEAAERLYSEVLDDERGIRELQQQWDKNIPLSDPAYRSLRIEVLVFRAFARHSIGRNDEANQDLSAALAIDQGPRLIVRVAKHAMHVLSDEQWSFLETALEADAVQQAISTSQLETVRSPLKRIREDAKAQ